MKIVRRWLAVAVVLTLGMPGLRAATLDSTTVLTAYPPIPLEGGTMNVATNGAGWYDFADRNGDGSSNAVSPAGLNLSNRNLTSGSAINLSLGGGGLTGSGGTIQSSYAITIRDVGAVAMGDGYLLSSTWSGGSAITIGQDGGEGPRAGPVQINGIFSQAIPVFYTGGPLTIHSTGDVMICSASGIATNVLLDGTTTQTGIGGALVRHEGMFVARDVSGTSSTRATRDMVFDGDALGNGASGTFTANRLDTRATALEFGAFTGNAGNISVSNYTAVTIGSAYTLKICGGGTGSILVTGIVSTITVTGELDLRNYSASSHGNLRLYAGGEITVNDLNLSNMLYAVFDGNGKTYIDGTLTGTDGNPASGLANIGTKLRTPAGEMVYYRPDKNPALGGQSLVLANPAGTAGAGGLLRVRPSGTVVCFR